MMLIGVCDVTAVRTTASRSADHVDEPQERLEALRVLSIIMPVRHQRNCPRPRPTPSNTQLARPNGSLAISRASQVQMSATSE